MTDLERALEHELHRVLDPISRLPIPARRLPAHAGSVRRLLGGAGAALALKVATGVVAAAAAVTVAGTAATGSANPQVWGQEVSANVQACKAALGPGRHGIGECVSDFAQTHGAQVSSQKHAQGGANSHGQDQGIGNGNGGGNANGGAGNGHGKGHGSGPPANPGKPPGGVMHPGPPPGS